MPFPRPKMAQGFTYYFISNSLLFVYNIYHCLFRLAVAHSSLTSGAGGTACGSSSTSRIRGPAARGAQRSPGARAATDARRVSQLGPPQHAS